MKKIGIILFLSIFQSLAQAAVVEFTLHNGLKVWVKPDHRAPVVVSMIYYKVGSKDELPGLTGISHMLEHMMFKGTTKYPGPSLTNLISEKGGKENAFTDTDLTGYYEELSKPYLPLALSLEADRMQNLVLTKADFVKELQVVKEERFMRTDDNPVMRTVERMNAAAFLNIPYHHPTVGWVSDLNQLTVENVRDWYHAWYGPNNATLIIVGDVEPTAVKALVEKTFGGLKPITIKREKNLPDPANLGLRQVEVSVPAKVAWLGLAYNVPSIKTAEAMKEVYALAVLSTVLGEGDSSRLAKTLVRQDQIASQAESSYNLGSYFSNLFLIDAVPVNGHTLAELEKAVQAQVTKLQQEPISEAELNRVKNAAIAERTYGLDSLIDQAQELGVLASLDLPWQLSEQFPSLIANVTAADVQAVAKKYLVSDRLTIARLNPLPIADGEGSPQLSPMMESGHVH